MVQIADDPRIAWVMATGYPYRYPGAHDDEDVEEDDIE